MVWQRLALVVLVLAVYVGGAMLIGTLLASKVQYPAMTPKQKVHFNEVEALYKTYERDRDYPRDGGFELADAETTPVMFKNSEEFAELVAKPACTAQRISFSDGKMSLESIPEGICLNRAWRARLWAAYIPEPYAVFRMCAEHYLGPAMGPYRDGISFVIWNPETCLETAAKTIQWKGYFDLNEACLSERRNYAALSDDKQRRTVRTCVFQSLERWGAQELERCKRRAQGSGFSCD